MATTKFQLVVAIIIIIIITTLNVSLVSMPRQCTVILIQKDIPLVPIESQANVFYLSNDTSTTAGQSAAPVSSVEQIQSEQPPTQNSYLSQSTTGQVIVETIPPRPISNPVNCLVTILNPNTVSIARPLLGSLNGYAPGKKLYIFGNNLKRHQIAEINIWTDAIITTKAVETPEEALSITKPACSNPIYIHPALQLSGSESIKNLSEYLLVEECIRAHFPNGELAVLAGNVSKSCNTSRSILNGDLKPGDITGLCHLKHVYRMPTNPLENLTGDTRPRICIGVPTISIKDVNLTALPIMSTVLTSLWKTIKKDNDSRFWYSLYVGYDQGDPLFDTEEGMKAFKDEVARRSKGFPFDMIPVMFPPMAQDPVYIWNHIFKQGQLDGCQYLYQLVDDIDLKGAGWSEAYVNTLASHNPPNYGMVGFDVGNFLISQPFTHILHLEIFGGYFYPPVFHNWYGDTWLSHIYAKTGGRTALQDYPIVNTQKFGQKYSACGIHGGLWEKEVASAQQRLKKWHAENKI